MVEPGKRLSLEEAICQTVECFLPQLMEIAEKIEQIEKQQELSWEDLPLPLRQLLKKQITGMGEGRLDLYLELRTGIALISSLVFFQKPINLLYAEAKDGNDEAFFNLVSLDKSIMAIEWAVERIQKAAITGDKNFFKKLSQALSKDLRSTKRRQIKLATILFLSWPLGFKDLDYLERVEFLEAAGFAEEEIPTEDTLRQQIRRWRIADLWKELEQGFQGIIDGLGRSV